MEYESRRDADDAYHEMHNKRIGRDDMLKIEVPNDSFPKTKQLIIINFSGLVLLPLLPGALTLVVSLVVIVVQVVVVSALLVAADVAPLHLVAAVAITLPARMIAVSATTTGATATARGAQMTVTVR